MKRKIALLYCLFAGIFVADAQPAIKLQNYSPVVSFQSPGVSSINVYGSIPVSLYTGTPDIQIPLYQISKREINLPVTLRYSNQNVKPNIHPGVTGLGWSLFCGGSISRNQKGTFDENSFLGGNAHEGYLGVEKRNSDKWADYAPDGWSSQVKQYPWYHSERLYAEGGYPVLGGVRDLQPDEFSFSFQNYSGRFYRNEDGEWVVASETDFKIEYSTIPYSQTRSGIGDKVPHYSGGTGDYIYPRNMACNTIEKFKLTAPDGTIYVFGGIYAIDYSFTFDRIYGQHGAELPVATTWHLSQIISPKGDVLNLNYTASNPILVGDYNFWQQDNFYWREMGRGLNFNLILPVYISNVEMDGEILLNFRYSETLEKKYPTQYFQNWVYNFQRFDLSQTQCFYATLGDIKWRQLAEIQNINATSYTFEYTASEAERLKLLSLSKKTLNTSVAPEVHRFSYNQTKLPEYLSGVYDHCGFYNGKDFSFMFAESFYHSDLQALADNFYNSRAGDATGNYVKAELLEKITYPTGGYSVLDFEPNYVKTAVTYSRQSITGLPLYPGGTRIKKITNYSGNGSFAGATGYYYINDWNDRNTPNSSSGILSFYPQYFWKDLKLNNFMMNHGIPGNVSVFSSGFTNQIDQADAFVGYSTVYECKQDQYGNVLGYTMNEFSNFRPFNNLGSLINDGPPLTILNPNSELTPFVPFSSKYMERGKLMTKRVYDAGNNLKEATSFSYTNSINRKVRSVSLFITPQIDNTEEAQVNNRYCLGGAYEINTYSKLLASKATTIYGENGQTMSIKTEYDYNPAKLLVSEKSYSSEGTLQTKIRYLGDIMDEYLAGIKQPIPNQSPIKVYDIMQTRNMLAYPIEITKLKNDKVIAADVNTFSYSNNKVLPAITYRLETKSALTDYRPAKFSSPYLFDVDSRCVLLHRFTDFDAYGNPASIYKRSGNESYLWGYKGMYPIAKITGSDYPTVMSKITQANIDAAVNHPNRAVLLSLLNNFRMSFDNSPLVQVQTYTYRPWIGMMSETDPSGHVIYYDYDDFGRLKVITDHENNILKLFNYSFTGESL